MDHPPPWLRRLVIVSDAWLPQINGVVRSLSRLVEDLEALGICVTVIGPADFRTLPCPGYSEIRLAIAPGRRLARLIEGLAPDALHIATEGPLGQAARRWARRHGHVFTTSFHTRFPDYVAARLPRAVAGGVRRLAYAALRRFHASAAVVMAATPSLRQELTGRGFGTVRLWPRGVDTTLFAPLPWPARAGGREPVFLYVGRLAVEKNIAAFLDLDLPGRKRVVGDGPERAALMRRYPDVEFSGTLRGADLRAAYAAADVMVFPSRTDTFGLVMLEALACGTPVAAYPVPGPADLLAGAGPEVAALDDDLGRAARHALRGDRGACRRFAERFGWAAANGRFLANLVPLGP